MHGISSDGDDHHDLRSDGNVRHDTAEPMMMKNDDDDGVDQSNDYTYQAPDHEGVNVSSSKPLYDGIYNTLSEFIRTKRE